MRSLGVVVALALSASVFAPSSVSAQPLRAPRSSATTDEIASAIVVMHRNGKKEAEVDATLLAEFGLTKPEGPASSLKTPESPASDQIGTYSTPSAINVMKPSIYRNVSGKYVVSASYQFTGYQAIEDEGGIFGCINTCHIGGPDGFGVAFSRPVVAARSYAFASDGRAGYYLPANNRMHVSDANTYGVTFKGRDTAKFNGTCCLEDYNIWNGTIVYEINSIGCGVLQAFSKFGHTWSNTSVNSFSVGPWSLGIGWSRNESNWEKASQPSNTVQYC